MRPKREQEYHNYNNNNVVNFNVNGMYPRQNQQDNQFFKQNQLSQFRQDNQQQNLNVPLNQNYWKNAENQQHFIVSSSQLSQTQSQINDNQQIEIGMNKGIQGRKLDSTMQLQIGNKGTFSMSTNMFYQQQNVPQMHAPYQDFQMFNPKNKTLVQNFVHTVHPQIDHTISSNNSSNFLKRKIHSKEETTDVVINHQIILTDGPQQISQMKKKKRPISSLNQCQLKTIQEEIKKVERKPRSTSNTPSKDKGSRSASKKKTQERSLKKISKILEDNFIGSIDNQENEGIQNQNQEQKLQVLKKKKKSSNSVHIKPVSKTNQPISSQQQQHSASKSKSPNKGKKNSFHNGSNQQNNGNILCEKNLNSPQKNIKGITSQNKSPEDKQKKTKKSNQGSLQKPKSKSKLSHAKSMSQLLVTQQQQHSNSTQQFQNDPLKNHTMSTQQMKDVEVLIKKNAQKIQFEQFVKKQEEIEEKMKIKQEDEKRKIQNEQIRQENLVKFCKLRKSSQDQNSSNGAVQQNHNNSNMNFMNQAQLQQKFAWGTNQQRIKVNQIIQTQLQQQQQQQQQFQIEKSQFNNTIILPKNQFQPEEDIIQTQQQKEKIRREKSGLSFLNNLNESFIKKKIEFEKMKQEQNAQYQLSEENKKKLTAPLNHEEIKKFMILKKKRLEYESKKRQDQQKERAERLKNNLHVLDQEIKNSRQNNSCQVMGNLEKDKQQPINNNQQMNQRSKSATQRKKKNRTVSTPNLEKLFNKTQVQENGEHHHLKKELSHKQFILNKNHIDPHQGNNLQEHEDEQFMQNNYFSNSQHQYAKKYDPHNGSNPQRFSNLQTYTNSNFIGQTNEINDENFEMLNLEFKKMFNINEVDDRNVNEFSQSINKTQQFTGQGQGQGSSHRLGSSGKKNQHKQTDYMKPKSISMHASSSVGNFKGSIFDSSHYANIQNLNQYSQDTLKEKSKNKKSQRKSQVTSISPEPKVLKKSMSTQIKVIQPPVMDNQYKKQQQQVQYVDQSQNQKGTSQNIHDRYLQDLINQKRNELKTKYSQINNRISQIKNSSNSADQMQNIMEQNNRSNNHHNSNNYPLQDNYMDEDQQLYGQKYYNQPLNNKKIQQAIQQQQGVQQNVNSNSLGSVNSSYRRVHISNASPIKEEPEEEDNGHFSTNLNSKYPHQKYNYINNFQQIFQNPIMIKDGENNQNNYPHKINSNPHSNESDSNRLVQMKELNNGGNNFQKIQQFVNDNDQFSHPSQKLSPPAQIKSIIPLDPISSLSKISPPSNTKFTPSAIFSQGGTEQKINQIKQNQDQNNNPQVQTANNQANLQPPVYVNTSQIYQNQGYENQENLSQINSQNNNNNHNHNEIQQNYSQAQPADPNAPVSLNFKETLQSKSYISSKNDQRSSFLNQAQLEEDAISDHENGVITSKELQGEQDGEMPILPLNLNFQYRIQQMKKRTHNTDNEEISQESSTRQKLALPNHVAQAVLQMQNYQNQINDNKGLQAPVTSKTPISSNREEHNNKQNISNQANIEKDYQQFQREEDIKLDLIKEIETQNQMSSSNFEIQDDNQTNKLSTFYQQKLEESNNPSNILNEGQMNRNHNQMQDQINIIEQNEENQNQQRNEYEEDGEEINVDYLYDLDYDQLQELRRIIFQSDPENPEIQALSEQLILYDAAATIIQKVYRGFYTRKCIIAILEYQRQQDEEEERLYQEAEKFLEENQIEPEELLEGNPSPFMNSQQNNLPYHPSDQLKEYEQIEMQNNKIMEEQQQQFQNQQQSYDNQYEICENDFPLKIKEYNNQNQEKQNNSQENNTFNRDSQVGEIPFLTNSSINGEHSANKNQYHGQKFYNQDLLQPKQYNLMPDFDFYDQPSEKIQNNQIDNYNQNLIITNNNNPNLVPSFLPQHAQNDNLKNLNMPMSNQIQPKQKFLNSGSGNNSVNYMDQQQQYNQLNLIEINEQSKSLVTVKEFDLSTKDKNKAIADSILSQQNQPKNLLSPQSEANLQVEITKLQEQAKMWNEMINQIVQLPQEQTQQFKENALKILSNLQKQSEMSKQILMENIKLNQLIPKSPLVSTDRFRLSELDNINDKQNNSNEQQNEREQQQREVISSTSANADSAKSIQNNQQSFNNINLPKSLIKSTSQQEQDKKNTTLSGVGSKKNLQIDIEEIESNYNEKLSGKQRKDQGQKIVTDQNIQNEEKENTNNQKERRHSESEATMSQEQRALVRALSVSSVESHELRYANIVSNNSLEKPSQGNVKSKQSFFDRFTNDQIITSNNHKNTLAGNESVSSAGSSFFDKQPFKDFTTKILQKFTMPQESVEELIKTREEAIEYKHKTQMDLIHKMHERNRISPKSFERKSFELEKWVTKERENLKNVKREIERGWEQFAQTIKQTKRDIEFLEQTKRIDTSKLLQSSEEDQLRRLLSMRSESEHSIEEIGIAERRSLDGIYQFRNLNINEDPNKIKIVDMYKPADNSTLSAGSSTNIRNRNTSDNGSQPLSARSRQQSIPQAFNNDGIQFKDQIPEIIENNFTKYNPRYLNVDLQLQLAQENQINIQKQQQLDSDHNENSNTQNQEQNNNNFERTLENKSNKFSQNEQNSNADEEEIDQFLTAEKNKTGGNIQYSQRKGFDAYGSSSDDLCEDDHYYTQSKNKQSEQLEIYVDNEFEHCDRLDVSPIFTVSSASKQGTQDKESMKFLMENNNNNNNINNNQMTNNIKIDQYSIQDKIKQDNKRNSFDSKNSSLVSNQTPQNEFSKSLEDPYKTIEYDDDHEDDVVIKKPIKNSSNNSPKIGYMRGDFMQEEEQDIEKKVNYISDQALNYLVDDTAQDLQEIKRKQLNELEQQSQSNGLSSNMLQINFMEPIKNRQNVYNIEDFPDQNDKIASLDSSQGMNKGLSPLQNNNGKNIPIPSPQNSPQNNENTFKNSLNGLSRQIENQKNDDKQQIEQWQDEDRTDKIHSDDMCLTQNSQQQLQFSEQILSTQNNLPGLECATLNFIKDYLVAFSEFIKDMFTDDFLERVNIPLGMDPLEFIKTFTITETIDNSQGEISAAPIYPIVKYIHMQRPVVSEELFSHFNDIFNRERDLSNMTEDLFELEKFHMRMIFDCFNEALDSMRPFGLRGKPLPWKINSNKLSSIMITPDNIEKILGLAIAKVLKWGSFLCGFIPERIESPTGEIVQIEDDYLNQIKEDRLAQMLENEVIENEDKWLTYEDEETDVQLEISDDIFNYLIEEAAMLLYNFQNGLPIDNNQPNELGDSDNQETIHINNNNNNAESLSKNIFGNPNINKINKKSTNGGGIRPTNDLGIGEKLAKEKKQMQKDLFLKNLQAGSKLPNNSGQKDALNSSF